MKKDNITKAWVEANIKETLAESKSSAITLKSALSDFLKWVERCAAEKRNKYGWRTSRIRMWGYGATSDNIWIQEAYRACGMLKKKEKAWKFHDDRCARTVITEWEDKWGSYDWMKRVPFVGTKHNAVDDCKHQVKVLVKTLYFKPKPRVAPQPSNTAASEGFAPSNKRKRSDTESAGSV